MEELALTWQAVGLNLSSPSLCTELEEKGSTEGKEIGCSSADREGWEGLRVCDKGDESLLLEDCVFSWQPD